MTTSTKCSIGILGRFMGVGMALTVLWMLTLMGAIGVGIYLLVKNFG